MNSTTTTMTTMVQVQRVLKVEPVGTPYIRSTDGKRVRKIQKTILIRQRKNKKTTRGGGDDDDCCFDNNNDNNNRNNGEHATTTSGTKTGIVSNDDPITGTGVLIHHVEGGQPHNGNNDVMYYRNKDGKYVRRIRKTRRKLKKQHQQQQQQAHGLLNDLEQTDRFLPEKVNETTCCPSIEHDESGIDLSKIYDNILKIINDSI